MLSNKLVFLFVAGFHTVAALPNQSYTTWYPIYQKIIDNVLKDSCTLELSQYQSNSNDITCGPLVSCILNRFPSIQFSAINSATVLLGLAPTLLATVGPSSAEIALLSSHRPLISLLLSLGAPSIYPARPLEYADPLECLRTRPGPQNKFVVEAFRWKGSAYAVSLVEYILALAAVANVIQNAVELGTNTVLHWRCNSTLFPLLWVLSTLTVHLSGVLSYWLSRTSRLSRSKHQRQQRGFADQNALETIRYWWASEVTPCANHEKPEMVVADEAFGVLFLNWTTTLLGLVHVVFGTLVLSSLLFISIIFSLYVVLRFLASALVCRSIVAFEISGLRTRKVSEARRPKATSDSIAGDTSVVRAAPTSIDLQAKPVS